MEIITYPRSAQTDRNGKPVGLQVEHFPAVQFFKSGCLSIKFDTAPTLDKGRTVHMNISTEDLTSWVSSHAMTDLQILKMVQLLTGRLIEKEEIAMEMQEIAIQTAMKAIK